MTILNEEEKERALKRLTTIDKLIEECLASDIPADHLFEEKHAVEDAIANFNAGQPVEEKEKEGNQDAPFHRVFLLIEVDQKDLADALDHLYRNCTWCGCIRTFEEV